MLFMFFIVFTLAFLHDLHPLHALTPPQLAQFRAGVDLIQVDVSVVDKNHRPVRDLTAEDFVILENGVPQKVAAFSAVDLPDPELRTAAWMRTAPFDVFANNIVESRLVILLIDERSTSMLVSWDIAKRAAHAAVDQIGPKDLGAVVYVANNADGAEFTNDRARLHASIDRLRPATKPAASPMSALTSVAAALAAVPNRRKTLIYIGPGESIAHDTLNAAVTPGRVDPDPRSASDLIEDADIERRGTVFQRLRLLVQKTQAANVNLYLIETGGLQSSAPIVSGRTMSGAPNAVMSVDSSRDLRDFMLVVAKETAGRAVILNNAPDREVPGIFRENGSYYLLGFRSSNPRADGQLRKLEVKVNRKDVDVRARRSYVAPRAAAETAASRSALGSALEALVPATDLPFSVAVSPFGNLAEPDAPIALTIRVPSGGTAGGLSFAFAAINNRGEAVQSRRWTLPASARSGAPDSSVDVHARVDLPPGRYDFRVSAQDDRSRAAGSVFASVDVPDAMKAPLSLSGIVLEDQPGAPGVLADDVPWFLPVRPTLTRSFPATASVGAFMRIYQGGTTPLQSVTVDTNVLDGRDAAVVKRSEPWDVAKFSVDRTATYRAPIPLTGLAPGPYLFKIRVSLNAKQTVERSVPLAVK